MHYVYVLSSLNKSWIYIGCTDELRNRFKQHQAKRVRSTKAHAPFYLAYYEAYAGKTDARSREFQLKNNSQQKELLLKRLTKSLHYGPIV